MPSGLQVWAPDGRQRIDTSTVSANLMGELTVGGAGAAQTGSISDPRFALGSPFYVIMNQNIVDREGLSAQFYFDGNTLRWSFAYAESTQYTRPISRILYGIR